jgi:two-component system OmpR family sensor kinase
VTRLSPQWRLTLVFALAMSVVLFAAGSLVYARVASDLSQALDQELRSRAQDLSALVEHGGSLRATQGPLIEHGETFAELVGAGGRVVDATPPIRGRLLAAADIEHARRGPVFVNIPSAPGLDEPARLLAVPVRPGVLVVGATRENRAETLSSLRAAFLIGGPLALFLASLGGYLLAGAALRPIEEGLARERRLVADASHELRTPLASLKTELELALRHERTAEQLEAAIRSAAVEAERLGRIADDLLLLARSEHGGLPLRRERIAAVELLDSVVARFAVRAEAVDRQLSVETDGGQTIVGDRLRLEQAVGNLVENALEHGTGPVRLAASGNGTVVELHVVDGGNGFPGSFVARAFDRFSRADDSRTGEGSGLGLAIVDAVARAHGGSAHAANRSEGGADVWIALPRA